MSETVEQMQAQFAELVRLADEGCEPAVKVIDWFNQVPDRAGTTGVYPDTDVQGRALMNDVGHTATLFWGARLLRWMLAHPGQTPTHFTFTVDVEFDSVT